MLAGQKKSITDFVRKVYLSYFGVMLGDQDKAWAPHNVCKTCIEHLRQWTLGKRKGMRFGVPMVWREQTDHSSDCYFCKVSVIGINRNNRSKWQYPDLNSARRPVPHSEDIPVPSFTNLQEVPEEEVFSSSPSSSNEQQGDSDFEVEAAREPFNQKELNDLIRDLNLPKKSGEVLASRLAEKNLLTSDTKITYYRNREKDLLPFFSQEEDLVFCNNIPALLNKLGLSSYSPGEWRLFIDSSKRSLKCVLLHNGNKYGSIPIGHSTRMSEKQDNIALVLKKISYQDHQWVICVDLKMVNLLLGQQSGYTKYPCFICLWDSRATSEHWVRKEWPPRDGMVVGQKNVIAEPLVDRDRIILPPLHIKLGLMKQFVKSLNKDGDCFKYICRKFPGVTMEKLKAGIFDGPQIRELIKDANFQSAMNSTEAAAWCAYTLVVQNFLGNHKAENYTDLVRNMLSSFKDLGCRMSIKVHYLHSHLNRFPENLGDLSEEQGERFHQDLRTMEDRYRGRWDTHMMADYCWSIQRDCPDAQHKKKSYKSQFTSE